MGKIFKITESQLNKIVDHIFDESVHSERYLPKILKYAEKNMNYKITPTSDGYRICPPDTNERCKNIHRGDRSVNPLLGYLSNNHGLTRHVLDIAIRTNEKFEKIKEKSEKNK